MIVSQDNNPQRELYYLGAQVIDLLNRSKGALDFFDTFQNLKEKEDISMNLFVLTIDWLYLLGIVDSKEGVIEKCF
ncbi:MAG: hypothetical protein Q9M22_00220 [Mariprofundaceae bacterium]|nr:hypothetical protein [Mariprofundaceae bacterium]